LAYLPPLTLPSPQRGEVRVRGSLNPPFYSPFIKGACLAAGRE